MARPPTVSKKRAGSGETPAAAGFAGERETWRRRDVLEAARGLFKRYGYQKTTMEDIARAAGITKPTVYTYFKGKEDILNGLVEWEASQVLAAGLSSQDENAGAPERLARMFLATDDFLKNDTFLQGIVSRDPDIVTPEVISIAFAFERQIIEALTGILEKGMTEGTVRKTDPRLLAYATVRLHEAFTFSSFFDEEEYASEEISNFFIETVTAAVKP